MPYRKQLQYLMNQRVIAGCIILDPSGNIWWHAGNFPKLGNQFVDGYYLLSEWVTFPLSVKVAGVKYLSIVNGHPNMWILGNTQGYGSLILQKSEALNYYFLCWIDDSHDPLEVQKEIKKVADLFGKE